MPSPLHVALFGGSFNPPHVGHSLAGLYALETLGADELWVVPTFHHAFAKALAPFGDRVAMCERAFSHVAGAKVLDVEAQLPTPSRTLHTVEHLLASGAGGRPVKLSLVVGADVWAERNLWYGFDRLEELVTFVVLGRRGFAQPQTEPPSPAQTPALLPDVSSSRVRAALGRRQDADAATNLSAWLSRSVRDYIEEKGLYL